MKRSCVVNLCDISVEEDRIEGGMGNIDALAANIKKFGLINPPVLVKTGSNPVTYKAVAGRRRIEALKKLGVTSTDATVCDDLEDAEGLALSENTARENLHPLDEGIAFARMLKSGISVDDIASLFCRSKSAVYQRAKLSSLCAEARSLFKDGKLKISTAAAIADLPENKQKDLCKKGAVYDWDIRNAMGDIVGRNFLCDECLSCSKRTRWTDETLFPEHELSSDVCLDHDCYMAHFQDHLDSVWLEQKKQCEKLGLNLDDAVFIVGQNDVKKLPKVSDEKGIFLAGVFHSFLFCSDEWEKNHPGKELDYIWEVDLSETLNCDNEPTSVSDNNEALNEYIEAKDKSAFLVEVSLNLCNKDIFVVELYRIVDKAPVERASDAPVREVFGSVLDEDTLQYVCDVEATNCYQDRPTNQLRSALGANLKSKINSRIVSDGIDDALLCYIIATRKLPEELVLDLLGMYPEEDESQYVFLMDHVDDPSFREKLLRLLFVSLLDYPWPTYSFPVKADDNSYGLIHRLVEDLGFDYESEKKSCVQKVLEALEKPDGDEDEEED